VSNVIIACAVPVTPLTVSVTACKPFTTEAEEAGGSEHRMDVGVVQEVLRHTCGKGSWAVAVGSNGAKLNPEIVTDA
jgi:hypothetical protein